MRICVVQTSFEGSGHLTEEHDPMCDPSRYISREIHQFEHRFIRKRSMIEDIDQICAEQFDVYFNCLWGGLRDNVAGIDAAVYLESKGVRVLTNKADGMRVCKDKLALNSRLDKHGVRLPGNTAGHYPKIIKIGDGANLESMDYSSVCFNAAEVDKNAREMKNKNPDTEILIQDYIVGVEVNVVVLEMGNAVVALEPAEYVFPSDTPEHQVFLTSENKFHGIGSDLIRTRLVTDEPRRSLIRQTAQAAFMAAGMPGGSGWGRVDMRIDAKTGEVFVLEINACPTLFYPPGESTSDKVVAKSFPGGHLALFEMLLATKLIQEKAYENTRQRVSAFFDDFSQRYESVWDVPIAVTLRTILAVDFDWTGKVLDLACGSGFLGQALNDAGSTSSTITGVDISAGMTSSERMQKLYQQPIHTQPLEEFIMSADAYDHIVFFNTSHYLSPTLFTAVLSRMFMLAQRSISIDVYDTPVEHIKRMTAKMGAEAFYNNSPTMRRFVVPRTWRKAFERKQLAFVSPHSGVKVYGTIYRFEKANVDNSENENFL